jgi:hypothetical protein
MFKQCPRNIGEFVKFYGFITLFLFYYGLITYLSLQKEQS